MMSSIAGGLKTVISVGKQQDDGINADDMTMCAHPSPRTAAASSMADDAVARYYDEKLKRWVDPSSPEGDAPAAVGPPPTAGGPATPEPAAAAASSPSAAGDGENGATQDLMAPPPSFRKKKPRSSAAAKVRRHPSLAFAAPTHPHARSVHRPLRRCRRCR